MTLRTVTLESLNDKHFIGVKKPNNDLELQLQLSRAAGNSIQTLNDGLFVPGGMMLVGPGRPDRPETTDRLIKGNEPNGFLYVSTNGAGVGAQQWQKVGGNWVCIKGDTGLITLKTLNLKPGAFIKLRRIDNTVFLYTGGLSWGLWGVLGKKKVVILKTDINIFRNVLTSSDKVIFQKDLDQMLRQCPWYLMMIVNYLI